MIKKFPVKIINLRKNQGRLKTRLKGAEAANFRNLLFVDVRRILDKNTLITLGQINYQPLIGHVTIKGKIDPYNQVLILIRQKIFGKKYFKKNLKSEIIGKKNFDQVPKGTAIFFCNRKLFIDSQPKKLSKFSSDDVRLFWNIIKKKKILKTSKIKPVYHLRSNVKQQIKHLFERAPRFTDYYFQPSRRFYYLFWLFIIIIISALLILAIKPLWFLYLIASWLMILLLIAILISNNPKELIFSVYYLPIITSVFGAGVLKGILLKLFRKY